MTCGSIDAVCAVSIPAHAARRRKLLFASKQPFCEHPAPAAQSMQSGCLRHANAMRAETGGAWGDAGRVGEWVVAEGAEQVGRMIRDGDGGRWMGLWCLCAL